MAPSPLSSFQNLISGLSDGVALQWDLRNLVLVVHFDVISLDPNINSVLAVVVANAVAIAAAADQFATTGRNTDLDVHTFWSAAATRIFTGTWILNSDDLRLSTWRHFVAILVDNIRVEWHSM